MNAERSPTGSRPGDVTALSSGASATGAVTFDERGGLAPLAGQQVTARALLSGMLLGGVLSVCNIYAGLKLGLVFNMSIVAALLSYGVWRPLAGLSCGRLRTWGILENNIAQTAASAGASVASAGLISAIPALTILTGRTLAWPWLAGWVFSVCLMGIAVAAGLRRSLILGERLPFPSGVATAETLRELHARGRQAVSSVSALLSAGAVAAATAWCKHRWGLASLAVPGSIRAIELRTLGFAISPVPLLYAIGGLIGTRACVSLLLGSIVAFVVIAPGLLRAGLVPDLAYSSLVQWLLWPGATLMVVAALTGLAFSWRSATAALLELATGSKELKSTPTYWSGRHFLVLVIAVLALSIALQGLLFGIAWWAALVGALLSLVLSVVAARASGEAGLNPVAAVGKVTQLSLAALAPQSPAANLMAANVTAGAASQCADLLDDLKCGHLLGAEPARLLVAQVCGALAGALVGSLAYFVLLPDPATQLPSSEWPAPGVVGMRAVAELFRAGGTVLPPGAAQAMWLAALAGLMLTVLERLAPPRLRNWLPSAASIGLAFILSPEIALTIFVGGMIALGLRTIWPEWSRRFLVTICAGLVAGYTLADSGLSLHRIWRS